MKKLSSAKTLLVSACCILLTSCATTQTQTTETSTESSAVQQPEHPSVAQFSAEDRGQLYFSILLADIASKQQLYDVAQSNFLYAAEQTGSQELSAKAAMLALIERDYISSMQAIDLWLGIAPDDPNAYKLAVIASLAQGQQQQAEIYLMQLIQLLPGNDDEKLYELIQMASFQDDADFISFYREVNKPISSPYIAAAEAYLHLKSDRPKEQYDRIHALLSYALRQKPEFLSAIELKGEAFALNSKQQRKEYLLKVLDKRDLNIDQTYKIGELLYTQRNYADALIAFERVLEERTDDRQTQFLVASSHYALEHYQRAADIFWFLARKNYKKEITSYYCGDSAARADDLIKAYTCYEMVPVGRFYQTARTELAQLYSENNQKQQAIKSLRYAQRKVGLDSRQQLLEFEINLLTQTGDFKEAEQRIESALQVSPEKPFLFYLKLQLLNQTQSVAEFRQSIINLRNSVSDVQLKTDITLVGANFLQGRNSHLMAYQLLEEASKQQPDNIDLLYSKALAAEPLEYYGSMEKDLRHILKLDPDHVHAKNSLGYTLADLNRSLEEAKELIESAYHHEPDNVAIQDSMGWVNYRLGNYEEALKYLEMAYERDASPEIASHLGEVLWVMQKQQRAIKVWQKALRLSPNNQYILRTLRRFPEANVNSK
ncbi:tetratricopeptide repeat protein [Kangiella sediminilitoris]|uniref:TPR repeat-containing protein n=1 Tax=Kangiella sediminilitoris TaxID=1144748 RepID=A0A1B3BCK3_9GAMM|nr:tetratricopeptide repeat protein [Kangiella sediminilitoris]AOE50522.1 TPR repeat-containing protein [Kangiella sediminilitoris]